MSEVDRLLNPRPLELETGWERRSDGVLHVACRTDLHGCTGEMFEWWFRSRPDTKRYRWWHPIDHIESGWHGDPRTDTHVGSEHIVTERMTNLPAAALLVQFVAPDTMFDAGALEAARAAGAISGIVTGRTGESHEPARTDAGQVLGGRLLHLTRDTVWGCVLRSHFFIGVDESDQGRNPAAAQRVAPGALGPNLLQHCYDEMTFLSRILPALHAAESGAVPVRPW